ncbi:TRAPP I complex [Rhizoclosmatium globosum]|uniref:TRAPP I complex n=1 Tax=Rhizoclosmatium globosum TaxID=329046 RepID=A0A1Y2CXZ9_9FUNG|nr:TRAPP I complex [Rhizoclosmatium globosum]|eukprot:ORY51911.1 TRAPP I complex [Rhizoclosmatium globosum]
MTTRTKKQGSWRTVKREEDGCAYRMMGKGKILRRDQIDTQGLDMPNKLDDLIHDLTNMEEDRMDVVLQRKNVPSSFTGQKMALNHTRGLEASLSAFSFLFSEMIQYSQKRVAGVADLEKRLSNFGYRVGMRELELTLWREKNAKRETRVLGILVFINSTLWKSLFGKVADSLQKSNDHDDEYMITDNDPIILKYISTPKELSSFNAGAFLAGIVEAVLDGCHFAARVTAHSTASDQFPSCMTLLIKFDKSVMQREKAFEGK